MMQEKITADLHVHTTASDGLKTAQEVVREAEALGLSYLAITDHDVTDSIAPAKEAARGSNVQIIPGVEMGIRFSSELHIVGLFLDEENDEFHAKLQWLRDARRVRLDRIVEKLNGLGMELTSQEVLARAHGKSVGRGHIAQTLIEKGYVKDTNEAFAKYLEYGRSAFVPGDRFELNEAIPLLRRAGAIPIWAHPTKTTRDPMVMQALYREMKELGLGGVEVFHPSHGPQESRTFLRWCREDGLFPSGGSDYHAKSDGPPLGWTRDVYGSDLFLPTLRERMNTETKR